MCIVDLLECFHNSVTDDGKKGNTAGDLNKFVLKQCGYFHRSSMLCLRISGGIMIDLCDS